jgi:hypothetical protein
MYNRPTFRVQGPLGPFAGHPRQCANARLALPSCRIPSGTRRTWLATKCCATASFTRLFCTRASSAVAAALEAFEPATRGAGALVFAVGSRFKGSIRDGLNGAVEPGFAVGSRFKGSVRVGLNGTVMLGFVVGSRFKGSMRDGLNGTVMLGFVVGSRFKGSIRDGLNGAVEPGFVAACGCAGPGPCRVAFCWGCPIKKQGILAADERRWTQISR